MNARIRNTPVAAVGFAVAASILAAWALTCLAPLAAAQSRSSTSVRGGRRALPAASATLADSVLAIVGGHAITRAELESRLEELPPQVRASYMEPDGRKQLLERMVEERVWLEAAEDAGVAKRPEVERQLESGRRNILMRTYLQEVMADAPAPTDSAVQAYYEAHLADPAFQAPEARRVRHIQLDSEKDAKDVRQRLVRGVDFEALARQRSKDAITASAGGLVDRVERNGIFGSLGRQPALVDSVFAAAVGRIVGPVKSERGWHVLRVEEIVPSAVLPIENVRPRILGQLSRETQESYYRAQLESAKQRLGYRMNQPAVDSLLYGKQSAADLFRAAQLVVSPADRITAYERVVSEHPKSEEAPQALFMVGFIYSEEQKDYDRAEAAFRRLLAEYPSSELAHSAQWMLDNMRSDAVPNFDLPGGVQRATPPAGAGTPGTQPR
jgi:peptidyl-prolyl cis-trans isomerase C